MIFPQGVFSLCAAVCLFSTAAAQPAPDAAQLEWHEAEVGLFIHWAPNVYQDREGDDRSTPPAMINPAKLDTDQWARAAKAFGAGYVVLVAKHVGGYCLWQTATTDYSIKSSPWKGGRGDIVAEMAASCEKHGLRMGFYLSPRDDHFGAKVGGLTEDPARQAEYTRIFRSQLTELLTRYGPMFEVWFDGTIKIPVDEVLALFSPGSVTFQGPQSPVRWVGNEHGVAPYPTWCRVSSKQIGKAYAGSPDGDRWDPAEVDVSLRRPYWFWSSRNAGNLLSLDQLVEIHYASVGRGANLLLNVTPDRDGLIPEADMTRLEEFGAEIRRRFGKPVAVTGGRGSSLTLELGAETPIDHVQLREDLKHGQRVRAFTLEGRSKGVWRRLFTGSAIGNRLIVPLAAVAVDAVRLEVGSAEESPVIRELSVFHSGVRIREELFLSGSRKPLDTAPVITRAPDGTFSFNLPGPDVETRYTTDGTEATRSADTYHEPQSFAAGVVRARFFRPGEGMEASPETRRRFGLPANQVRFLHTDSAEEGHGGELAGDANPATFWHTAWKTNPVRGPHEITFDLGKTRSVKGFSWLPRQDRDGNAPASVTVHVADRPDAEGMAFTIDCAAAFRAAPRAEQWFDLPQPFQGRYVRLVIPVNVAGNHDIAAAEIQVDAE